MIRFWSRVGKWVFLGLVAGFAVACGPLTHKLIDQAAEESGGKKTPGITRGTPDRNVVFEIIPRPIPCKDDGFALEYVVTNNTPDEFTDPTVTRASRGGQPFTTGPIAKGQSARGLIWHDNLAGCGGARSIQATLTLSNVPLPEYPTLTDSVDIPLIQLANLSFNIFGRTISRSESRIAVGFSLQNTGAAPATDVSIYGINGTTCDPLRVPDVGPGASHSGTVMCDVPASARQSFTPFTLQLNLSHKGGATEYLSSSATFAFGDATGPGPGPSTTPPATPPSPPPPPPAVCTGFGGQCRNGYQFKQDCIDSWRVQDCRDVLGCFQPIRTDGGGTNCF